MKRLLPCSEKSNTEVHYEALDSLAMHLSCSTTSYSALSPNWHLFFSALGNLLDHCVGCPGLKKISQRAQ